MENLLLGMPEVCEQAVEKLGKTLWAAEKLYTNYAQSGFKFSVSRFFSTRIHTGFAQLYGAFTQLKLPNFNLLIVNLYPVYTTPINNTNLIKD